MTAIILLTAIWFLLSTYKPTIEYIKESKLLILYYSKSDNNGTTRKYYILYNFKK